MRRLFAEHRPTAVVNFAAESHVDRSIDDASAFIQTNVVGTFALLEAARALSGGSPGPEAGRERAFRFLHVSTDEVYGSLGADRRCSPRRPPYAPNSPYAASKAAADHLVRAYHHTYGLPALITNCSNNYGPYQFPEKLIPLMILNALDGKPLPIYGDGGNVRDWLYVEDHCRGVLAVLRRGAPGEKYNIGGGSERTNLEIVDAICDLLEAELPAAGNPALAGRGIAAYRELKTFVADRPGHDRRYAIDDAKIRRELGWAPRQSFEDGAARHRALVPRPPRLVRGGADRPLRAASGSAWGRKGKARFRRDEISSNGDPRGRARRAGRLPRRPRLLSRDLPDTEVRHGGGIPETFVQDNHSFSAQGHPARPPRAAPPAAGEADPRHPGRDLRRGGGHPPGLADLRPLGERGALRREPPPALRPARVRPRLLRHLARPRTSSTNAPSFYDQDDEIAVLWNDPAIGIAWPTAAPLLSPRDLAAPTLAEILHKLAAYGEKQP